MQRYVTTPFSKFFLHLPPSCCPPVVPVIPPFWSPFVTADTEISVAANSQRGKPKVFLLPMKSWAKCFQSFFFFRIFWEQSYLLHSINSVFGAACWFRSALSLKFSVFVFCISLPFSCFCICVCLRLFSLCPLQLRAAGSSVLSLKSKLLSIDPIVTGTQLRAKQRIIN